MESVNKTSGIENKYSSEEEKVLKCRANNRGKKRKRKASDSSSNDEDLPDNMLLVENKVQATAFKNNLDDNSVRKILKKVVTNDHVLALVKLREEEEEASKGKEDKNVRPKLTRAKVRELMKVSPKSAWSLEKLELTPIKHIHVKTRPEVKALIAQELPEDEDDEEYEPTHEDVPSDDDQGLESCSDVDSQPRTPATPLSQHGASPKVVTDGPFKVPKDPATSAKRKLELEGDATIALRTRSKLSLSSTSIEHLESTFVPPDDVPLPHVDDLWNQFLEECLNPASTSKTEDDDETDPEYNVAADADAHDEDEEALSNSIIKISKKELSDLVTELFSIMPEATVEDKLAENMANTVLTDNSHSDISHWEGKQEPASDDEQCVTKISERITFEKTSYTRLSLGKNEMVDMPETGAAGREGENETDIQKDNTKEKDSEVKTGSDKENYEPKVIEKTVSISIEEIDDSIPVSTDVGQVPPLLRILAQSNKTSHQLEIQIESENTITPTQVLILQQQLRQHIQLATSNFLQLYVHPSYWSSASAFKEYLETFVDLTKANPRSVVDVCNLKPAMELVYSWEKTVAEDKQENLDMVRFMEKELEKNRRNAANNHLYVGSFPELFKEVVANSVVFQYPHLLPPIPYRADPHLKRNSYLHSEDSLIALGLEQFCAFIEANPKEFPRRRNHPRHRPQLSATVQLVTKHMLSWITPKLLLSHIHHVRKMGHKSNPIVKFMKDREIVAVKHKLLPFNPSLTLYEQPEVDMPKVWLRHLAKNSARFRDCLRVKKLCKEPEGVTVDTHQPDSLRKDPLPIDFTKEIPRTKFAPDTERTHDPPLQDRVDVTINKSVDNQVILPKNIFELVETSNGAVLMPLTFIQSSQTNIVSSINAPITTVAERKTTVTDSLPKNMEKNQDSRHCTCCVKLRKICKRQTTIVEYFKRNKERTCYCSDIKYPKISNRLRLLINNYKSNFEEGLKELEAKLKVLREEVKQEESYRAVFTKFSDLEDLAYVTSFQIRLTIKTTVARNMYLKRKVYRLLSTYNFDTNEPMQLASRLGDVCNVDLVDMYKDFLGFLTAEQADVMGVFKDYFTRSCVKNLVRRVEEEVKQQDHLTNILSEIHKLYLDYESTACEMCTKLLLHMKDYPQLAQYVFSLFPHRKEERCRETANQEKPPDKHSVDETHVENGAAEEVRTSVTMDYEADHSSSDEEVDDNDVRSIVNTGTEGRRLTINPLKIEEHIDNQIDVNNEIDNKPTTEDLDSDMSVMMICEAHEEDLKVEPSEWKRDEDKLILEILKQFLGAKDRESKTLLEIISENNVFELITDTLLHKSKEDVRQRVMYLLEVLIQSEK